MPQDNQGYYFFDELQQFLSELEYYLEESEKYLNAAQNIFGSDDYNFPGMFNCVNTSKKQVSNLRYYVVENINLEEDKYLLSALTRLMNEEY
ncbi:hypothetical protein [Mastigocoleus testarum]|uniref:Uncharacterized protein n=1 Tax=Mastigocoleus testarum BC008 TaxID=371196 RepID=A0A0V7ZD22_9CYAN|nr:hypothetical protein [Mastigocoleus testarum]KST62452.1 hypothetical protein BC008_09805 [Mastigocoleus testarum BC008]